MTTPPRQPIQQTLSALRHIPPRETTEHDLPNDRPATVSAAAAPPDEAGEVLSTQVLRPTISGQLHLWRTSRFVVAVYPPQVDNADNIRITLLKLLNAGIPALIVDLANCRSCSFSGMNALLRARIRATAQHIPLRIVVPTDQSVRTLCQIAGLTRAITATTSITHAQTTLPTDSR